MKRLFSGIQPTGSIHVGNYLGALKNWVALQEEFEAFYCIVDQHAITIEYDVGGLRERILETAAVLLACGVDAPQRCTLFVQSAVPEHTELAWVLNTVTPMSELARMTQFKAKSAQHEKNINVGLFSYPVLQTADILLYLGEAVPVGEDQVQHIELARIVARKFNNRFGQYFPEPFEKVSYAKRIKGLDGQSKMSKSLGNHIGLLETPEEVWEKLKTAFTDPARKRKSDPGTPEICNMHTLHTYLSSGDEIASVEEGCRTAGIGCFQCKRILADNMEKAFGPIRERALGLLARPDDVRDVLARGERHARGIAAETMGIVRRMIGLR